MSQYITEVTDATFETNVISSKLPVLVEHDPNCMALAERWLGEAREVNNLLFLRLAMGIGMSIIINGENPVLHRQPPGRITVAVVPAPVAQAISSRPPCSDTMRCAIGSPSPVPPGFVL